METFVQIRFIHSNKINSNPWRFQCSLVRPREKFGNRTNSLAVKMVRERLDCQGVEAIHRSGFCLDIHKSLKYAPDFHDFLLKIVRSVRTTLSIDSMPFECTMFKNGVFFGMVPYAAFFSSLSLAQWLPRSDWFLHFFFFLVVCQLNCSSNRQLWNLSSIKVWRTWGFFCC